ncbi:hypothetical protein MRB53_002617 [Persea americana]|uniref:Uncharacterized protein n=1 Tax=Persea americana TaxID=3435 RepID=A0ACC2MV71_PERAE|nr:hypothetical protein MRB53_002617 [Persea americana]
MARRTSMAVDSDIPFSQMDQRIDRCLGHFRKEFSGEISAKALGPRGGEYGSFLPVYLKAPLYLSHHTVVSAKRSREKFEAPTLDSVDRTSSISSSLTIEEFNENGQKKRKTNNDYIHAANVLKEATNLRHAADHLKNGGESVEIIGLYLHAAIKFLNGAFLLDNMEGPIQIYIDSAKLSMYCATTFERIGEMAAAALAHKCVEVAYMRVLFSMSSHIQKDEHDIQPSVQHSPLGNQNRDLFH